MNGSFVPLHVERSGPPDGTPLILLHGFGASSYAWRHWLPELERRYHVVRIDMKGFGRSPGPRDDRYTPLDQSEIVTAWIRREVDRPPVLLGNSIGGGVAALSALSLRDGPGPAPRALILVAGAVLPQPLPRYIGLARTVLGPLLLRLAPSRPLMRRILREITFDPSSVTEDQVEEYSRRLRDPDGRAALLRSARTILDVDSNLVLEGLRRLDIPSLLIWGTDDHVIPRVQARRLMEILPDARLVELERCGHLPQEERPQESLRAALSFLDGL